VDAQKAKFQLKVITLIITMITIMNMITHITTIPILMKKETFIMVKDLLTPMPLA